MVHVSHIKKTICLNITPLSWYRFPDAIFSFFFNRMYFSNQRKDRKRYNFVIWRVLIDITKPLLLQGSSDSVSRLHQILTTLFPIWNPLSLRTCFIISSIMMLKSLLVECHYLRYWICWFAIYFRLDLFFRIYIFKCLDDVLLYGIYMSLDVLLLLTVFDWRPSAYQ